MLGSSAYGAQLAAHLGMPYAFAHFITDGEGCESALSLYRSAFRPGLIERAVTTVCLSAIVAETDDEAWHLFKSRERARVDRRTGHFGPLLPPEQAVREYSPAERAEAEQLRRRAIVGSAATVRDRLLALAEDLSLDEIVVVTWTWDPAAQRRSYELLAEAFGLGPSEVA
jgi:luciferase family oxidoreductase group 1